VVTSPLRTRFIYDCREGEAVALLRDAELVTAMELRDFSDRKERTPGALSDKALKSAFGGRILGARKLCERYYDAGHRCRGLLFLLNAARLDLEIHTTDAAAQHKGSQCEVSAIEHNRP
jgi:hypothetical protein